MNDRGHDSVCVNFEHTRQILQSKGFAPERVHSTQEFDNVAPTPIPASARTIAICINGYDPLESNIEITDVSHSHGVDIVYRVHDADLRVSEIRKLASQRGACLSLATGSKIQNFLQRVDVVVTANANIIADPLIARKSAVYYWAGQRELFDYYGFVESYNVPHASSRASLENVMNKLIS